ncbi:MAG: Lrp/AsnC family transcriptional regulator [Christensenellales bacterium]|jgi:DNA-binding Lrp family transcriptional regulator
MNRLAAEIIEILNEDARRTPEQIAGMLGSEAEKVETLIRQLEQEKVILRYKAVVDQEKVDHEKVQALIEVRLTPQRDMGFDSLAKRIYRFDEVQSVYLMSGSFDLMVMVEGRSMKQVALFVAEKLSVLEGVLSTATHFVLRKYKEDGVVIAGQEKDSRLVVTP